MRTSRLTLIALGAVALAACLGGGKKVPAYLLTLTPSAAPSANAVRSADAGQAVTIDVPVIPEAINTVRVPALVGPTAIAYIQGLQWVETPDRLFQNLVQETVLRTTGRVVLDPRQSSLDPGLKLTGNLSRFGYDAYEHAVVVRYDGALSTAGGTRVESRRFEAKIPADGTAGTVGPALNQAANQVAAQVAQWIGG